MNSLDLTTGDSSLVRGYKPIWEPKQELEKVDAYDAYLCGLKQYTVIKPFEQG